MKKKLVAVLLMCSMGMTLFAGCGSSQSEEKTEPSENSADWYQYAEQCGFSVTDYDGGRCGNCYYSLNFYLYCGTETADPGYVLRCGKRLIDKRKKESKNEEKNRIFIIDRRYGSRCTGWLRRTEHC